MFSNGIVSKLNPQSAVNGKVLAAFSVDTICPRCMKLGEMEHDLLISFWFTSVCFCNSFPPEMVILDGNRSINAICVFFHTKARYQVDIIWDS